MLRLSFTAFLIVIGLVGAASAEGDAKKGKRVFKKCAACHSLDAGKNKVGPSLHQIVGADSGAVADFSYSDAMANAGLIWDEETLTAFLSKPKEVVPDNNMAFSGLKKEKQIADLIAYLKKEAEE